MIKMKSKSESGERKKVDLKWINNTVSSLFPSLNLSLWKETKQTKYVYLYTFVTVISFFASFLKLIPKTIRSIQNKVINGMLQVLFSVLFYTLLI